MSAIVCSISGIAPEEPAFSPKTGHVYEKRLIIKQIEITGKCPVTQEAISKDDIVDMKTNKVVRPRPASATSIPGMLSLLQSEWDALMTETYELKTHLDTTRKQLSHALYQHDAACRVIARLLRERDSARLQVTQLQEQMSNMAPSADAVPQQGGNEPETGFTPEIIQRMQDLAKSLSKTRKRREFPTLAPVADVKKMVCSGSHPVHQSTAPGILCLDIHKDDDARVVTGGVDSQVILFDGGNQKLAQKLLGHSKKVNSVSFHPTKEVILSASQDMTARVWTCSDKTNWKAPYTCAHVVRRHKAEVVDLSVHPLGDFMLTASLDRSWALHDLATGRCVRHVTDQPSVYHCMKFHPDGLILAGGTEENTIAVWDVKEQAIGATLTGHEGPIETLAFSENGYYLASGSRDGAVKLWDLRKPLNIQTLKVSDGPVNSVRFDSTGQYLIVGSSNVQIYNFETKSQLGSTVNLDDHTGAVMGVCFGSNARSVASVSMDRMLKLYKIE
jgi:pre-mRNA-processing factor 19|eukprot:TRINITY_DN62575_c0_g1_i1.p1 TRINITY_DN62575_c0_g1~~TRINITY_DN62575_c0_g1_i1.p1  ORF type:complete len:502 (-),score=56.54 TRINITY_DN62575_c0_g1_i1:200-1705(-)